MFSSPPKRRKSSAVRADASAQIQPPPALRPDSDRASYRSPTRASLARSHPDVLQRALSRSPTKSPQRTSQDASAARGPFGLRDRKALRPSLGVAGSPLDPFRTSQTSPNRRASGIQAFAVPPRRVSRRIVPSDLAFQSPTVAKAAGRDETRPNAPEDQLASELSDAVGADAGVGLDLDLDLDQDQDQPPLREEYEEPDLPPTPTQLGLERAPERPVGLGSSSPSARTKVGRRLVDIRQSPSKLRRVEYGAGDDAEERSESTEMTGRALFPEPVVKKRKLKNELSAEVARLKKDISELERWSGRLDGDEDAEDFNELISLLVSQDDRATSNARSKSMPMSSLLSTLLPFSTKIPPKTPEDPLPNNTFALDQSLQTDPFLTVFGPLKLAAQSNTVASADTDGVRERHELTLSAPRPFPSKLYSVSVVYETNPETQSVVSVTVPGLAAKAPEYLRRWIDSRLANPLMSLDVSGLCWGISRYWEAAISRAQVWSQIEDHHAALVGRPGNPTPSSALAGPAVLTRKELRRVLPHLERTSMLFESKEKELRLIVSCELAIDEWASEPRLRPGITVSAPPNLKGGAGKKIEQESKRLFHAILSENRSDLAATADGIDGTALIRATDGVVGVLFGNHHP
ncbi:hypothetical protein BDV59DRAFT_206035 [Aspergillus ambiguus]|uniref:uncharacterized protein n=1 Tax=Aspergillus ambiguus TaxID=176160 RepID=UPI003CCD675C